MAETRTIELGPERSLHVVIEGEGPDVVLLHGALETSHDWLAGPFGQLVAEGYRVTAVDRPGHGLSRRPRFEGTPRDQARQIRDGLDVLGVERPLIVGHSYGGLVALAYAEGFPDSVSHLVLVAPLAFPEVRLLEHSMLAPRSIPFFGPLLSGVADAIVDRALLKLVHKLMFAPQEVPASWEESYPYDLMLDPGAMVREGEDAAAIIPMAPAGNIDIASIRTPAYVLTGTSDKIVDYKRHAQALAEILPNARLTLSEGTGHMPHHAQMDLVLAAVADALARA